MSVVELKSRAQFNDLINNNTYVAIQAHAAWCGPCKAISPFFAKYADALSVPEKYAFAKFDTDDVPDLAFELGIRSIPAFFFFANGDKDADLLGAVPPKLKAALDGYAAKVKEAPTGDKPAEPVTEKAAEPAAEKAAEPAEKPAEAAAEKPVEKAADKPAEEKKEVENTLKTDEDF